MRPLVLLVVLLPFCSQAQMKDPERNEKFYYFFAFDFTGHLEAIGRAQSIRYESSRPFETAALTLSFEAGYFVIPEKLSIGLGLGYFTTSIFALNSTPLTLNARYFFLPERNSTFVFTRIGRLWNANDLQDSGYTTAAGIGKKVFYTNKLAALISLGYNFHYLQVNDFFFGCSTCYWRSTGLELKTGFYF